ncbi:hypothetical protein D7X94_02855 [Acutalibacter sp. 1XD8-33]|nr:hypothetical protein D7X94_02855 [Acutalibacter sp. 1XD8-33]
MRIMLLLLGQFQGFSLRRTVAGSCSHKCIDKKSKFVSDLHAEISPQTLARIRRSHDVLFKTAGKLAKGSGMLVTEIIEKGE